jgi:hypothetical protein
MREKAIRMGLGFRIENKKSVRRKAGQSAAMRLQTLGKKGEGRDG